MKHLKHFYFPDSSFMCRIVCPRPLKEKESTSMYQQKAQTKKCLKCEHFDDIKLTGNWINIHCKKNGATQITAPLSIALLDNQKCPRLEELCKMMCTHRERVLYAKNILIMQCSYHLDKNKLSMQLKK